MKTTPKMSRGRMEIFTDILLMLAELPTYEDAQAVLASINRLELTSNHLLTLFRPCELPSTTRRDLAERAGVK